MKRVIAFAVEFLLANLKTEDVKIMIDGGLDVLEDRFKDNPTKMRVINYVRTLLGIPDDIGGDKD